MDERFEQLEREVAAGEAWLSAAWPAEQVRRLPPELAGRVKAAVRGELRHRRMRRWVRRLALPAAAAAAAVLTVITLGPGTPAPPSPSAVLAARQVADDLTPLLGSVDLEVDSVLSALDRYEVYGSTASFAREEAIDQQIEQLGSDLDVLDAAIDQTFSS